MSKNPLFFSNTKGNATSKQAAPKSSSVLDQLFSKIIKHERAIEETEGDGNCAFNAFVLGLCDVDVLNGIEARLRSLGQTPDIKLAKFISRAAVVLGREDKQGNWICLPPTWVHVRRHLLKQGYEARVQLQIKLAPVMRDLAIDLTAADPADIDEKWDVLENTARQYFAGDTSDDIFLAHAYVRKVLDSLHNHLSQQDEEGKFDDSESDESDEESTPLKQRQKRINKAIDENIESLRDWWYNRNSNKSSGYEYFLTCMRQPRKWGGDLELGLLGNYFHVNVFNRQANGMDLMLDRPSLGSLPLNYHPTVNLNDFYVTDLRGRGIVEGAVAKNGRLTLSLEDHAVIQRRLQAVPELDRVLAFMKAHKKNLRGQVFISDKPFSPECIKELSARNVIARETLIYFNKKSYEETLAGVRAFLGKPEDKFELERVLAFIKLNANNLSNTPLNATQLSEKALGGLLKRDIVSTKVQFKFDKRDYKEAFSLVNAFPEADKLFLAIKAILGAKKPHIVLRHRGDHWENTRMFTEATDWMTYHMKGIGNHKWERLLHDAVAKSNEVVKQAKKENAGKLPSLDGLGLVNYYLAGNKPISVLKADQEKLDESVAKRMQEQEMRVYRSGMKR